MFKSLSIAALLVSSVATSAADRQPNIIVILADDLGYGDLGCFGQKRLATPRLDAMAAEGMRFTQFYVGSPVGGPSQSVLLTGRHAGRAVVRGSSLKPMVIQPGLPTVASVLKAAGYATACVGQWEVGTPDLFAHDALRFIREQHKQPFFLCLALNVPHANNEPGGDDEFAAKDWPEAEKGFAAMIRNMDRDAGRALDLLKELGIAKDTLVLFTSDNGPHEEGGHKADFFDSNGRYRGIKPDLTEGGIRVPMIAWWPGTIAAGGENDRQWYAGDLMATAAELAGVQPPDALDSDSFVPALHGQVEKDQWKRKSRLYWETSEGASAQALRFGKWKAIRSPRFTGELELYDLSNDFEEKRNYAARRPDLARHAIALLDKSHEPDPHGRVSSPAALPIAEPMILRAHERWVAAVQFSPDGKHLASGGDDEWVKVWDMQTGEAVWAVREEGSAVTALAFSPDGKRVVAGRWDGVLQVRDARDGRLLATLRGHAESITAVAFSPDGKQIASGSGDDSLKVWDSESGEESLDLPSGNEYDVTAVAFSADGNRIVSGDGENSLKIWDARSGEELTVLEGHSAAISAVACSKDGRRIVSGSWDRTLRIWDARGGEALATLRGHADEVTGVALGPDGSRIISGSADDTVKVWDARSGAALLTLRGGMGKVTSIALRADGRRVAAGGRGIVKIWELPETK